MGTALKAQGDLGAAIDSYNQAIKIKPDYAEAHNNMGNALKDKGDLDAAIDSYQKAIKIKPDYADAYSNMGNALKDKGDLDAAIVSYKQALEIKPDHGEAKHLLASLNGETTASAPRDYVEKLFDDYASRFEKNIYNKLVHGDILEYLSEADLDFDYFISTDVFVYVGELSDVFRLIKSRNRRGGKLVFSTEHIEKNGFYLEKSGRYSHSKQYIGRLCDEYDYQLSYFRTADLRKDKDNFVTGGLYLLDF
jgi:predicted TPR repeat methyltransferase